MTRQTRPISWVKAARKEFEKFPLDAQSICLTDLTIAAEGSKAGIVKPLKGARLRHLRDCFALARGCVPDCVCGPAWRGDMGASCVSEEINAGNQDSAARHCAD